MSLNKKVVNEDKNNNVLNSNPKMKENELKEEKINKESKDLVDINDLNKEIESKQIDNEKLINQVENSKKVSNNNKENSNDKTIQKYFNLRPESKELIEQESRILENYQYISPSTNSVLQNPFKQLYNFYNNYSICPFCKYVGKMKIEYMTSNTQRKCCFSLAITGIYSICSWIPFFINDCADQVYKCPSCNKELEIIKSSQFI